MSAERIRMAVPPAAGNPAQFGEVVRVTEDTNGWNIVYVPDWTTAQRAFLVGGEVMQHEQEHVLPTGETVERVTDPRTGVTVFTVSVPGRSPRDAHAEVTVYGHHVNWSALGSQSPHTAKLYAQVLLMAADWAAEQDAEGPTSVERP